MANTPHAHDAHHEEHIHLPPPSIWPLILALGIGLVPFGVVMWHYNAGPGIPVMAFGAIVSIVSGFFWATSIIKEKADIDLAWGATALSQGWLLFLLSEAAVFGAFFAHYYYLVYHYDFANNHWPPSGTPHIHLIIPAVGSIILVTSSVTCELGHKALLVGQKTLCKTWIYITIFLGLLFLSLQAYEWGYLMYGYNFYPNSSVMGTIFYMITGFHGFHVITGLLFLIVVYARLEMGSFDRKRHFSMNAASWYWHFVDVIWFVVFLTLYVGVQEI